MRIIVFAAIIAASSALVRMLSFSPKPGLRRAAAASATEIGAAALTLG